ncbi:YdjY domain-containing protein [Luteolibacter arcticus]|uniref:YdjY domain-containing protein n=1 Tax=Luteolibacter arcticus TaxID=1581411 RepID=A0ABT3GQM6_9BACT|nr:YdjY domain-containing protein [Luteolibacter arcticus]MCW1925828.1 YdjY domain-containing protein [Luteolibacter arcticus]
MQTLSGLLRSGSVIAIAATLGVASAGAQSPPDPAQGAIDGSGKFIPATKPEGGMGPATPEAWKEEVAKLIEKTGETTFRIGRIQCDRATRTISFPAKINAREGLVEYALVTTKGKVHEALLAAEVSPLHLHVAALLIGLAPQGEAPKPVPVTIEVEWATNGPAKKLALEDLLALAHESPQGKTGGTLARGPWHYQGSVVDAGGFAAERDGSIIALISDSTALAGNPRAGGDDDTLYLPNTALLPSEATPVTVTLRPVPPAP